MSTGKPKNQKSHKEKIWQRDLGIEATVRRDDCGGVAAERANAQLREIGDLSRPNEHVRYVGSAAFHVYVAEGAGVMQVVSQVQTMQDCNELVAIAAHKNFSGDLIEFFGHRRSKLRSGF